MIECATAFISTLRTESTVRIYSGSKMNLRHTDNMAVPVFTKEQQEAMQKLDEEMGLVPKIRPWEEDPGEDVTGTIIIKK